jgi:hypothetical protein
MFCHVFSVIQTHIKATKGNSITFNQNPHKFFFSPPLIQIAQQAIFCYPQNHKKVHLRLLRNPNLYSERKKKIEASHMKAL